MKKLLLGILFLCAPSFADLICARIDASVNNLATTFSTSASSLILSGVRQARGLLVDNRIASEIAVNCSSSSTVAPSNSASGTLFVAGAVSSVPTQWHIIGEGVTLSGNCYVRTNTGSPVSSGIYQICLIGN